MLLFCVEFELVWFELSLLDVSWLDVPSSGWVANVELVTVTLAMPELSRSTLGLLDNMDVPSISLCSSTKLIRPVVERGMEIALCARGLSVPGRWEGLGRALTVESVDSEVYDLIVLEALCRSEGGLETG